MLQHLVVYTNKHIWTIIVMQAPDIGITMRLVKPYAGILQLVQD